MSLLEAPFLPKGGSVEVLLSLACSETGGSATVSPVVSGLGRQSGTASSNPACSTGESSGLRFCCVTPHRMNGPAGSDFHDCRAAALDLVGSEPDHFDRRGSRQPRDADHRIRTPRTGMRWSVHRSHSRMGFCY